MDVKTEHGEAMLRHPWLMAETPDWLCELVELIYEGVLETVPWTQFLEQLRLRLQANYVSLAIRAPAPSDPGLVVYTGDAQPVISHTYERSLYRLDPFVDLPPERMWMLHEVVDEQLWLSNRIYRDFLQRLQIRHLMGADLAGVGRHSRLRMCRNASQAPFSEQDRLLGNFLLPHLNRALRLYTRLQGMENEHRLYAATLERLSIGTLQLDAQGHVLQCSRMAARLLEGENGLRIQNGRLQANSGLDERRLWRAIREILEARSCESTTRVEALSLGWKGRGLGVLLRGIAYEASTPTAVEMIVRDPQSQPEPSDVLLRQLFQFTPSEAALAVQLCLGLTLEEAALALNISRNTARAHLRVIFSKTGVSRQTALVQLLLGSVAALSPVTLA